jgi:hypothetical protein
MTTAWMTRYDKRHSISQGLKTNEEARHRIGQTKGTAFSEILIWER